MLELNREWTKFRNGTLIGLISSGVLFLFVVSLILRTRSLSLGLLDFSLLLIAGALLGYIYTLCIHSTAFSVGGSAVSVCWYKWQGIFRKLKYSLTKKLAYISIREKGTRRESAKA